MNQIEQKVCRYIQHHHLLKHDGRYIVALSGGADSVALLLIMHSIMQSDGKNDGTAKGSHTGIRLSAAHCNFHLRGEESDRDEQFCVALCERLGIPLSRIHFDTMEYAQLHKVSIEMAARDLRYRYFAQLAHDLEADGICVAHHRDDNVETLLLNLLRGSGIDGLAGIAPKNGNILRPLLCISRADILQYLKENDQEYVTDSTNLEDDALRNKIRHHVIPLLQSLNPAASDNIALSAKYVRQACDMLQGIEQEDIEQGAIYINKVKVTEAASPEFMLHKLIGKYGFHGDCIDNITEAMQGCDKGIGKIWKSNDYMLSIDRDQLIIMPQQQLASYELERPFRIPEEGNYTISQGATQGATQGEGDTKLRIKRYAREADFQPSREPHRITLDADKVEFPLEYRRTQTGDRFHPFCMKGTKLVSDYLTDRKRNMMQKMQQHVLTDRTGEIIWLIGERTSEKTKITADTKNILEIIYN